MISYSNETKVRDIASELLKNEIEALLKHVLMDFGMVMAQDVFSHTVGRLTYLISSKYKGLLLGEVKYVFEVTTESLKGKVSVASIMQLFSKYYDEKVERQRREMEDVTLEYENNYVNCFNSPLGSAIIHKMNMVETGQLQMKDWDSIKIKDIAAKIKSGEIVIVEKQKRRVRHIWDMD